MPKPINLHNIVIPVEWDEGKSSSWRKIQRYWRSRENPSDFSQGMRGHNLLPIGAQVGFSLEKPIELTEAQDVYAWVSHTR